MIPFFHSVEKLRGSFTGQTGIRIDPWPILVLGLVILFMAYVFMPDIVALALSIALFLAPIWLPLLLVSAALGLWLVLKRSTYIANQKYILLEIKPPRNLVKTPLAMEAF